MTLPERASLDPTYVRASSSARRSPAGTEAARCGNDRAQRSALDAVTRHVRRRNVIRRVLADIDQELQAAVTRAREAGVSDRDIAVAAVRGQRRDNNRGRQS